MKPTWVMWLESGLLGTTGALVGGCTNSILLPSGSVTSNHWLPSRPVVIWVGTAACFEARYVRKPWASVVLKATWSRRLIADGSGATGRGSTSTNCVGEK